MTLDEMLQLAEDQARRVLLRTREELAPQWLYVTGEGNVVIVATPWENNDQKHLAIELVRDRMREDQAVAYSLLVEAWFVRVPIEEVGKEYTGPPPSQRADRRESVVITAADRAGEHRHRHFEIVRDFQERCIELKRLDMPEDQITSELFDNLLDDRRRAN